MSKTNCITCGAAKKVSDKKCQFCGTEYVDLSMLDFTSNDPVYVQVPSTDGEIVTAKAYITNREIEYRKTLYCNPVRDEKGRLNMADKRVHVKGRLEFVLEERI